MNKQPYRITVDLRTKERYDYFIKLSEDFYDGKQGKTIRKILDKVKSTEK